MAKRLPRPQARPVDTFVQPTLRRPQAPLREAAPALPQLPAMPAPPARPAPQDNQMSKALQSLVNPLLTLAVNTELEEQAAIKTEEEVRVAKLTTDEVRKELTAMAKSAEQRGELRPSANPVRRKAAMEFLAERVMRDEYYAKLVSANGRFTSPLNTEDPARFARKTFEEMNIPGYYAQVKATELYKSISSAWMSQIVVARDKKVQQRTVEDYENSVFETLSSHWENPDETTMDVLFKDINARGDDLFDIAGVSGKDQVANALGRFVSIRAKSAALEGDLEELERLESIVESFKDQNKPGSTNLSKDQLADLETMQLMIESKIKESENYSDGQMEDFEGDVQDIFNSLAIEAEALRKTEDAPSWSDLDRGLTSPMAEELRRRAVNEGIPTQAIDNWLAERYDGRINALENSTKKSEAEILNKALLVASDYDLTQEEKMAQINGMDLNGRDRVSALSAVQAFQGRIESNIKAATKNNGLEIKGVQRAIERVGDAITSQTGDVARADNVMFELSQRLNQVIDNVSNGDYSTDKERENALREALEDLRNEYNGLLKWDDESSSMLFNTQNASSVGVNPLVTEGIQTAIESRAVENLERMRGGMDLEGAGYTPTEEGLAVRQEGIRMFDDQGLMGAKGMDFELVEATEDIIALRKTMGIVGGKILSSKKQTELIALQKKAGVSAEKTLKNMLSRRRFNPLFGREFHRNLEPGVGFTKTYYPLSGPGEPEVIDDPDGNFEYTNAKRIAGLTPDEMRDGRDSNGFPLNKDTLFKDPYQTLMVNPETFEDSWNQILDYNNENQDVTQEQMLSQLSDNDLVIHYLAYREFVGSENAISFGEGKVNFIKSQLTGMGSLRIPPLSDETRKKVSGPVTK